MAATPSYADKSVIKCQGDRLVVGLKDNGMYFATISGPTAAGYAFIELDRDQYIQRAGLAKLNLPVIFQDNTKGQVIIGGGSEIFNKKSDVRFERSKVRDRWTVTLVWPPVNDGSTASSLKNLPP